MRLSPSAGLPMSSMRYDDIFAMVGKTPHLSVRCGAVPAPIFLKLEGCNPTGSIKDRACLFMIRAALADGALSPGKILLDASSGNFACSLALFAKTLGYPAVVAVSSKLTAAKRDFLNYLGAKIHEVGDFTIEGNKFCKQMADDNKGRYCFLDQLHNWNNPRAHFETTAREILNDFPEVAMVVGSLGSGGTMTGIAEYMRTSAPQVKIVAVECKSGNRIPGTGTFVDGDYRTPFIQRSEDRGYFDRVVQITESDAARSVRALLEQGIFCGLQTGGVLDAALTAASALHVNGTIVCLSGDTGWKNLDKLLPHR